MTAIEELSPLRARLERELQERLAHRRQADTPLPLSGTLPALELVCRACEGINDPDANFCKHCGSKFNVSVRVTAARGKDSRAAS